MADRPMATAPERSTAAFSTRHTRSPWGRAHWAASKAAPHPAMPPPTTRTSHSTVSIAGSKAMFDSPRSGGGQVGQGVDEQVLRLAGQQLCVLRLLRRDGELNLGVDRAPGGGADRILEPLDLAVAELDGPHDRVRPPQGRDPGPHGHHIGVAS